MIPSMKKFSPKNLEKIKVSAIRNFFAHIFEALQEHGKTSAIVCFFSLILMFFVSLAVFFAVVQSPEQVLVPDVVGKELSEALIDLQAKELFPKIELVYTESQTDKGKILSQQPSPGSISKASRRITLEVSRGSVLTHIENYVGQNVHDVRVKLQNMFAGISNPPLTLAEVLYQADDSPEGTILAQTPAPGTSVSSSTSLRLVASGGDSADKTPTLSLVGMGVDEVLRTLSTTKLVFDFSAHAASGGERAGTVVSQENLQGEVVPNFTRVSAEFAFSDDEDAVRKTGLFTANLPHYPFAVRVRLEARQAGRSAVLASFEHPGGYLSIPYSVASQTELVLFIVDREESRLLVE
ncbi:MAG: PASTA domain-containing protein [Treponemataceae bacterium]|nr:MAG: PASTA domain-containing protein [Treponemataceae bacterium]